MKYRVNRVKSVMHVDGRVGYDVYSHCYGDVLGPFDEDASADMVELLTLLDIFLDLGVIDVMERLKATRSFVLSRTK